MDAIATREITTDAGTFRLSLHRDEDPMSPREHDNVSVIVYDTNAGGRRAAWNARSWDETRPGFPGGRRIVDSTIRNTLARVQDGEVSTRAACRYLAAVLDAWTVLPLHLSSYGDEISVSEPDSQRGAQCDGFVFDTPERRAVMLGGDETPGDVARYLRQDVETYSRWLAGDYVGYVVTHLHDPYGDADPEDGDAVWTFVEDCWSIDDVDYAWSEAEAVARDFTPADFVSPVMAAQV